MHIILSSNKFASVFLVDCYLVEFATLKSMTVLIVILSYFPNPLKFTSIVYSPLWIWVKVILNLIWFNAFMPEWQDRLPF